MDRSVFFRLAGLGLVLGVFPLLLLSFGLLVLNKDLRTGGAALLLFLIAAASLVKSNSVYKDSLRETLVYGVFLPIVCMGIFILFFS